jgi:hypothetical protein
MRESARLKRSSTDEIIVSLRQGDSAMPGSNPPYDTQSESIPPRPPWLVLLILLGAFLIAFACFVLLMSKIHGG